MRSGTLLDVGGAVASAAIVVGVVVLYVSREHTFYSSDYAGYHVIAQQIVAAFHDSLRGGVGAIVRSTRSEYNAYFTVPLTPWLVFDRDSRLCFELALAVSYLLPFALMMGAVGVKLVRAPARAVFWSTVAVALATPMTWVPTLRGYPDCGAGLLVVVALWLYLRDVRLRRALTAALVGACIAASFLFRRHFAYAVIAFIVALEVQAVIDFARHLAPAPRAAWRALRVRTTRVALTALAAVTTSLILGYPIVVRGLTTDYNALYAAYLQPPLTTFAWYAATYGWVTVGAAALGYVLGRRADVLDRDAAEFIVLFGAVDGFEWLFVSRQTGEQYTMHFTPVVVLGVTALLWTVWRFAATARILAVTGLVLLAAVNLVVGLTTFDVGDGFPMRAALAMNHAPLRRADHAEVTRLVGVLRDVAGHGEPIYVAASSDVVSTSLVASAERTVFGSTHATLRLLYTPQIDSRDPLPLETLVEAEYVVTAAPFQHHMEPEKQRVVRVVDDLFATDEEIARDFAPLPETFTLEDGVVVRVYRRTRPTSLATAVRTLAFMRTYLPSNPGGQGEWLTLSDGERSGATRMPDGSYRVTLTARRPGSPLAALYVGPVADALQLTGSIVADETCGAIAMTVVAADAGGRMRPLTTIRRDRGDRSQFTTTLAAEAATAVALDVAQVDDTAMPCSVVLDGVRLERAT